MQHSTFQGWRFHNSDSNQGFHGRLVVTVATTVLESTVTMATIVAMIASRHF
jgi:hypothetical protein